jgi:hypothetical protein
MSTERTRVVRAAALLPFLFLVTACPGELVDQVAFGVDSGAAVQSGPLDCDTIDTTLLGSTAVPTGCAQIGCHPAKNPMDGLDLQSPDIFGRLVGKPALVGGGILIDPGGDPNKSLLYLQLGPSPPVPPRMPLGPTPLDPATIACVATWIMDKASAQAVTGGSGDAAVEAQGPSGDAGAVANP